MPVAVPFPTEDTVDLAPPSAEEVELITRALATGAAGPNGLTDTQRAVLNALTTSMTGITVDVANETGYIEAAAQGFFGYDRGHLCADAEPMATRLADAMYRGAALATFLNANDRRDDTDLLGNDWFTYAEWPLADLRAHFGLPSRSELAVASGSVTPWEHGGISPFQRAAGQKAASARDEVYESYGAIPV